MATPRRLQQHGRGFTLVELLAVVTIMGILATIGLSAFIKQANHARTAEVRATIKAICAAQERFRAENLRYFDVSSSLTAYYPTETPDTTIYNFYGHAGANDAADWSRLKPQIPGNVRFGYATVAGLPGAWATPAGVQISGIAWPATVVSPWYLVQAKGDQDGNGVFAIALASSFSNTVLWQNEDE